MMTWEGTCFAIRCAVQDLSKSDSQLATHRIRTHVQYEPLIIEWFENARPNVLLEFVEIAGANITFRISKASEYTFINETEESDV